MDDGRYSSYTQRETFCADVEKTAARFAQISDPSLRFPIAWLLYLRPFRLRLLYFQPAVLP